MSMITIELHLVFVGSPGLRNRGRRARHAAVRERASADTAALMYAERMHAGQRRADGTPFILDPLEVASLLFYAGPPDHLIAAGVMHDLIKKTDASAADLRERFGSRNHPARARRRR